VRAKDSEYEICMLYFLKYLFDFLCFSDSSSDLFNILHGMFSTDYRNILLTTLAHEALNILWIDSCCN